MTVIATSLRSVPGGHVLLIDCMATRSHLHMQHVMLLPYLVYTGGWTVKGCPWDPVAPPFLVSTSRC